ncbi:S-adenosyl-L-methionine-dependent methyltransferase [Thozetella sp. PMI_491]|nr:S-adenosyl-L-methionine-dependent methyltransferase [Thozetella sp. PMI_491]
MTQYDEIGAKYGVLKTVPAAIVEMDNVHDALKDKIAGARVLDLACGLGFFSHKLLGWGASFVLGIDMSSGMIEAAKKSLPDDLEVSRSLEFRVGNVITLGKLSDQEPFDIVLGVWLLNYSTTAAEMTQMFETISANLKPGGLFVGVAPHPAEDLDTFVQGFTEAENAAPGKWGVSVRYVEKMAGVEGWEADIIGSPGTPEEVKFRSYHLHRAIYEQAAKAGGMTGKLQWPPLRIPDRAIEQTGEEFWTTYRKYPTQAVLFVEK